MIRNILIAVAAGIIFAVIAGAVNSYIFSGIILQAFLTGGFGEVGVIFVLIHTRKKISFKNCDGTSEAVQVKI